MPKSSRVVWCLSEPPVLGGRDFTKPLLVYTNASGVGIGAVLAQEQGGQEHPFFAYQLKGASIFHTGERGAGY